MTEDPKELVVRKKVGPAPVPKELEEAQEKATVGFFSRVGRYLGSFKSLKALGIGIERTVEPSDPEKLKTMAEAQKLAAEAYKIRSETEIMNKRFEMEVKKAQREAEAEEALIDAIRVLRAKGGEIYIGDEAGHAVEAKVEGEAVMRGGEILDDV